MPNEPIAQFDVDDILSDALASALGNVIRAHREEWKREHELANAQKNVIIAELRRGITEFQAEARQTMNDLVFWAETSVAKTIENVRDGKDGNDGKNGEPGKDAEPATDEQISLVLKSNFQLIAKAVKNYFDENPMPAPEKGDKGEPGNPGADLDIEVIRQMVLEEISKLPPAKDGKDANPEEIKEIIKIEVGKAVLEIEIPTPKDGEPGKDGKDGVDGKSVDEEQIREFVLNNVQEAIALIPTPKNGEDGKDGANGTDGLDGKDGTDGHTPTVDEIYPVIEKALTAAVEALPKPRDGKNGDDGKPGKDGKDGADVVSGFVDREGNAILTLTNGKIINLGVVVGKDGKDGAPGLGFQDSDFEFDGQRRIMFKVSRDGATISKQFVVPSMIYQGVYEEGKEYERGDCVTWGGSLWHCDEPTKDKPGAGSKAWTLAVKRGADGKDRKVENN